ncbi:MAG TPA: ATP-dependent RecD-like DNA helicase [Lentisphaeria bacterium]|nr:ATP-dependent RecD-like DNA helicase [Lentisphaeria bacterium]
MDELNLTNSAGKQEHGHLLDHTLRGEIKNVVYTSDDETYTVLKLIDSKGAEHVVVGPITGAYAGQGIELSGIWENHREHGRQFKAKSYKYILPSSADGIKRYLSSGLIPGIGPKYAEAIVNKFGDKTLDVLDNYSGRLNEIPGLGKKRVEMVKTAWKEHEQKRDIFIFLQSLGISTAYAVRIYKVYGDKSPQVVRENPYRLAEDVDGMGFIMSDKIGASLGLQKTDDARLSSGILYSLNRLGEAGHVCYPESEFIKNTSKLLDVEESHASRGLDIAIEKGYAVKETIDGTSDGVLARKMIYSSYLYNAEKELSILIAKLSNVKIHHGQKIKDAIPDSKIHFNPGQLEAVTSVSNFPLSIITGGPGVGKTTVVGEIVRHAKIARLKVYLAAPTGRASKRLSESCRSIAMTIHRMLKWEPAKRSFYYGSKNALPCDLLIVDEVSMLDIPLALYLFRAVAQGTTVVMVGDSDQLPSVGPGTFLADMIMSGKAKVTHLTQIYRQKEGSRIITNAHAVNAGRLPDISPVPKNVLTDFYWIEQDEPEQVLRTITEMVRDRIPKRFGFNPMQDIQVLSPMNRGSCGTIALNRALQAELNPEDKHRFHFTFGDQIYRSGDRVMQTSNNYDKGVFNGDMGRIAGIMHEDKKFRVAFEGNMVDYDFIEADQLNLAYAITVHKSQGSEFPVVIIPLLTQHFMMLQKNLLYTGMTRAKKLLVIIGCKKALAMAVNNTRLEPRFSMLLDRLKKT